MAFAAEGAAANRTALSRAPAHIVLVAIHALAVITAALAAGAARIGWGCFLAGVARRGVAEIVVAQAGAGITGLGAAPALAVGLAGVFDAGAAVRRAAAIGTVAGVAALGDSLAFTCDTLFVVTAGFAGFAVVAAGLVGGAKFAAGAVQTAPRARATFAGRTSGDLFALTRFADLAGRADFTRRTGTAAGSG